MKYPVCLTFKINPILNSLSLVSPPNQLINGVLMTVLGFFIGGASNIIGTAVTTDIGKQPAIGANTDALSTVTGECIFCIK